MPQSFALNADLQHLLDWDPEDDHPYRSESENEDVQENDKLKGREHYESLGESSLRKFEELELDLGDDYDGMGVRREYLGLSEGEGSDDDSDEESGDSQDAEGLTGGLLNGRRPDGEAPTGDMDTEDSSSFSGFDSTPHRRGSSSASSSDIDGEDDDASDADSASSLASKEASNDTDAKEAARIRALLSTDATTPTASVTRAAHSDIEKGRALKRQRIAFDALLNTRIKLQSALVASNTLFSTPAPIATVSAPSSSPAAEADGEAKAESIQSAERAALNLWNDIHALRTSFLPPPSSSLNGASTSTSTSHLSGAFTASPATPTSTLWSAMQDSEARARPQRRATLQRWAERTTPLAPSAGSRNGSFGGQRKLPTLLSALDTQLAGLNLERWVAKSRVLRSCGPVGGSGGMGGRGGGGEGVYDDSGFYALLLRDLVDQRGGGGGANGVSSADGTGGVGANRLAGAIPIPTNRDLRVRNPNVDRKASKGRKMRYEVHPKLQNFMVSEDRGGWGERQRGELFASLLGHRRGGHGGVEGKVDEVDEGEGDGDEGEGEGGGLRLFG